MTNLIFNTGTYKEYRLNGGETIRVNVSDPGIVDRLRACPAKIVDIQKKYGEDLTEDNLGKLDAEIRALIDGVINCPGACDKAFGATNCLAIAGGQPIFVGFIEVLLAQLKKDIVAEQTAEKSAFETLDNERTRKYITQTQSKPQISQPAQTVQSINIAALSQAEREKLLAELIGEPK